MRKALLCSVLLLHLITGIGWAQSRNVSGKVISNEDNTGLPGVNIRIQGTTSGTVTDLDGNYTIEVPSAESVLQFSFVGFVDEEVTVGNRSVINVELYPSLDQLSELVVVGYGTQVKEELTGNIARVGGDQIQNVPVPSVEQAIQGRAAGVFVNSLNGKVGQGINIRIRGASSINASNDPLYVIDGIPVTSENQSNTAAPTNPLADLNFNDIESMEILKDASAAAIYGSRASNGVVIITTKKGKAGATSFNINYQYGVSRPTNHREFLNASQYIELLQEAAWNNDVADGYFADVVDPENPALIPAGIEDHPDYAADSWLQYIHGTFDFLSGDRDWRTNPANTNWEELAFQDARTQELNLSASGGTDKTRYYASGSFSDQDGILIGNNFKRISGRLNLNHELKSNLDFNANVGISRTLNARVSDDNEFATPLQLVAQSPLSPVRDPEGNLYDDALNPSMFYYPATVELENSRFETSVWRNLANTSLVYEPVDGLRITGEYGFDLLTQNEDRYQNANTQGGRSTAGWGSSRWLRIFNYTTRAYANYVKPLGEVHDIDLTGGVEFQKSQIDQTYVAGQNFPSTELTRLVSAAEITDAEGDLSEYSFLSYFLRANYKLLDRYLLGVSGRVDASSRFGANNRYGFFPAVSAGWILSEESFLQNTRAISFLKLRASYGITGNAAIGNFTHLGLYDASVYGGQPGFVPYQLENPDLSWERTAQLDVGFDFGFFKNRINGELDYYVKNTTDLLLERPVPYTSGYRTIMDNIGSLRNRGVELVLNGTILSKTDLQWTAGLNMAYNQNEVLSLNGDQQTLAQSGSRWLNDVIVGEPIGVFYGQEYAGVNPDNGDALWYVNDEVAAEDIDGVTYLNQGGRIATNNYNLAQRVVLGNPTPEFIYGVNTSLTFKGFDLSVLFQGVEGNKIFNGGGTYMTANGRYEDNQTVDQMNRWQKPGDITDVPQARLYSNNGAQASSRYLYDGSYLRLKNLTLGYSLPKSLLGNYGLGTLRFYAVAQNLLTFTQYPGWDPEVNTDYAASNISLGNDFYSAPQARTIVFGAKLSF
ncbi:TonB-dependent receptor [Cesiribacter sp. SM1]|uniref:SusC/RagA family TonB-linked outer membrane protein n=1 Tax=Cesiribacter sp. SM1 TaxID=2861196 RepID=UPI001CD6DE41|nr:TonB-dependent receptor [Cesiribacter sp. SM1]